MPKQDRPVHGVTAPPVRPTFRGALWLASLLAAPVFVALGLGELVWRALF
ncbi:hypothetical protein [Tropicimonas sp. IMCC34043]|nr:hypothetical protein [Tropicimonas sp. IMCC34043]